MNEKHKFMYTPSTNPSSLRTSYQPSTSYSAHTSPVQVPYMNFNSSLNYQKPAQQEGPPVSSQYKNLSMSMKQFQSKVESVYPGLKREDPNGLRSTTDNMDYLRSSVSTNQIKKVDKDFLRRTAYTPNNPKTFNIGSDEPPTQQQHAPEHSNTNVNMFHKKMPEMEPAAQRKPPSSAFFKSLYSQDERHSLQKRSPIVCGFYLGKQLGVGKFGQVYLAKHITSGFVCALKKIVKAKVRQYNMVNQLIQQIKIQAFLSHPNIVQFYSVLSDQHNIYIVLQYMQGGTLFDYMNTKQILPQPQAVVYLREISMAIKEMHDKDIAHRDIKPQNIVMSYGFTKLCDFGWAARIQGARKTYCGTLDYVPPEILERKEYDQTVDLWCLGILAYELLTGKVPFQHKERKMLVQKIVNVDKDKIMFPETMSPDARDFIQNLIKKNPNERMKSYKLLQHPFLYQEPKKEEKKR